MNFSARIKTGMAVFLMAILLGGCKCKDCDGVQPEYKEGFFRMAFDANASGQPWDIGQQLTNTNGQVYSLNLLKFYAGNVELIKTDGSVVKVKDIVLIDFDKVLNPPYDANAVGTAFTFVAPVGDYKGIRFGLGVPEDLNGVKDQSFNPAQYPNTHPLSAYRGTDWSWAGYRFIMAEGTSKDGTGNTHSFEYHIASDTFYHTAELMKDFKIEGGQRYDFNISLDVNKLFYNSSADSIDMITENYTHSTLSDAQQTELAWKITRNLERALQPE